MGHLQAAAAAPLQDVEMSDLGVHNITINKGTTWAPQNRRHSPQALHVRSRGAHDGTDDALCAAPHALRRLRRWDQEYAPCAAAHALRRLRAGDHDCGGDAPVSVTEPCSQPFITSMTTHALYSKRTQHLTHGLCKACYTRLVTCCSVRLFVKACYEACSLCVCYLSTLMCGGRVEHHRDVHERQKALPG